MPYNELFDLILDHLGLKVVKGGARLEQVKKD